MPDKLIPGKKRTMAYKKGRAKSSAFQMKGNPFKNEVTRSVDTSKDKDVTKTYKTKGNKKTREHIAKGGKVIMRGDQLILTSSPKGSATPKASPYKGGWWAKQTKGHGGPS
tara:strand:+ start:253 stop:585 length:333 start_codon:yes stop_codon:yes gene_type:complete